MKNKKIFFRETLKQILEKRIGVENFLERLNSISKSEAYIRAAQKPYIKAKVPSELMFDYQFTKLFRNLEGKKRFKIQNFYKDIS